MRIALDAMGGDYAPREMVAGAAAFLRAGGGNVQLTLVGDSEKIERCLSDVRAVALPIQVVHAAEAVEMHEAPAAALRKKKDASIRVAVRLVASGQADAVVSAGNTGAVVAAAKMELAALAGIDRPAIAALIPGPFGATVLLDAGATINCKALHLLQFAQMGVCYAQYALRRTHPMVGLLSVGEEDAKGTDVTRDAFRLLRESRLHFYGNVEGRDFFSGKVDVIVCDGFVGNVALKVMEGMACGMRTLFERGSNAHWWLRALQRVAVLPVWRRMGRRLDATRFGGAPLLGVAGTCIIAHGNSRAAAVVSAIERAREAVAQQVNERITEVLAA